MDSVFVGFIRHIVYHMFVFITQNDETALDRARRGNEPECVRIIEEFIGMEYIYITY